ncbi:MAG: tRNA (adenosine(37)-N6)-threonylcarbamoyltransferase complex transferase subunit TsaD [Candidatus Moranbacteria bacterium CG_4_9_14_3_um_filter_42_9]|nr:MAG: tRNA (adenosine(37)-N6)-threonylcarbamoyltransferase complex transferase subunit TsaD [Candidatus Moranbacteria bacterium CG_4_9_14_3_um_filter_42_9]
MIILAIETSCDETAVAITKSEKENFTILSETVSSQIKLHAAWGGVVPNLAAREHLKNIIPVIEYCLKKSAIKPEQIDLIATTKGPGLIPALLIGNSVAKTLAWLWKKPLLGVNHIEGHIYANFVGVSSQPKAGRPRAEKFRGDKIKFPLMCLVVSGGHTQLALMKNHLQYKIVGQTLDDAAGEAFDKVARMLGLGYPGGPAIAACAAKRGAWSVERGAKNDTRYALRDMRFPRPMINSKDFNFSFSGLKTAVLYLVKKIPASRLSALKPQICHEFQQAIVDILLAKTVTAAKKYRVKTIMLAGGVSANKELREQLGEAIKFEFSSAEYRMPQAEYSIDNAVMIAAAAHYRWKKMTPQQKKLLSSSWKKIGTDANLKLI